MTRRAFLKWLFGGLALIAFGWYGVWRKWFGADKSASASVAPGGTSTPTPAPVPSASPSPSAPEPSVTPASPASAEPLLSFFILSDLHVSSGFDYQSNHLKKALDDLKENESKILLVTGDLTDAATDGDYRELRRVLSAYKLPPMYVNLGNHDYYDIWMDKNGQWSKETMPNGKSDATSRKKFLDFFKMEKPYQDVRTDDCHFILLSQETYVQEKPEVGEGAWYSDEQMAWFKAKMAEGKAGKPTFVFIHQPLPPKGQDGGSHQLIRAKEFREIVKPYKNVFVFWGHNHQDFRSGTPHYVRETFHGFNNSSVGRVMNRKFQMQDQTLAQALYVQVYDGHVHVRGREFSNKTWIDEANWKIDLEKA